MIEIGYFLIDEPFYGANFLFQVLTTILDRENVEGFASIILKLVTKSGVTMSPEQRLLSYQWLEHLAVYSNQAVTNPTFAKNFLQVIKIYPLIICIYYY